MSSRLGTTQRSDSLIALTMALGILHHTDHVLRVDHSGWPFVASVTPFTFSLLVYPVLLTALLVKEPRWVRVTLMALVLIFVQAAHTFLETPAAQFHTWAEGVSHEAWATGQPNLLHVASPFMGVVAVLVSIALSVALVATLVSVVRDSQRLAT